DSGDGGEVITSGLLGWGEHVLQGLVYFLMVSYRDHLDNSSKGLLGGDVVDLTSDEYPTNEDGDTGMGDLTGV
nr:hypothetical protein [Tanacetum cinerariifolium]